ncbi:MAG: hypothetical protein EH225_09730 [Calditrichaeota bacterium]|nr:MAG: hypothetical protein EH225_09730 [Calditrichota bacterium]
MFIGHFGTAFAAKKVAPGPSLGTLIMAAQFIDLVWPLMLLLGLENVIIDPGHTAVTPLDFANYPITHSLLGVLGWGILFGLVYFLIKKNLKNSLVLGLLVLSHWILDLLVHIPDLPLIPGLSLKVGLGLWNSLAATLILEGFIFLGGVLLYTTATRSINKRGMFAWWGLVIFLMIVYSGNIFGTAPPDATSIAVVGLSQWLLVAWGYWIDRNRKNVV